MFIEKTNDPYLFSFIMWFLYNGLIGIWRCWFLWREKSDNNKLNPRMASGRIEPGPHLWEASDSTTAPFLVPTVIAVMLLFPHNKMIFRQDGTRFSETNITNVMSCKNSLNRDHS